MRNFDYDRAYTEAAGPNPKLGDQNGLGRRNILILILMGLVGLLVLLLLLGTVGVKLAHADPIPTLAPEPPIGSMLYLPYIRHFSTTIGEPIPAVTPTPTLVEVTPVPTSTPTSTPTATPYPPGTPFPVTPSPVASDVNIEFFDWYQPTLDLIQATMTVCNYSQFDRIIAPWSQATYSDGYQSPWENWSAQTYLVPAGECIYPSTALTGSPAHGLATNLAVQF